MTSQASKISTTNVSLNLGSINYNPSIYFDGTANELLQGEYNRDPANPTEDKIVITGNKTELSEIQILNYLGQNVSELISLMNINKTPYEIDLSPLTKGIYFIKTRNSTYKIFKK
jgi:hypothetical protein